MATKKFQTRYYLVQIDDEGTRIASSLFATALAAARSVSGVVGWLDPVILATTGSMNCPEGGERWEIGYVTDEESMAYYSHRAPW